MVVELRYPVDLVIVFLSIIVFLGRVDSVEILLIEILSVGKVDYSVGFIV